MKLRYIIPSFVAALSLFTACSDDQDPTYLSEVRVSSSYVAIDQNGGSTAIDVTANGSWEFDASTIPSWLSVSPVSGSGAAKVSFSAESTIDGRSAELLLNCGGQTQRINVIQGLKTISPATCAEIIAGPDSKTYRVTGVCRSIANTTYGNWYLNDGTGEIYIYGTLDSKGAEKNFSSLNLEEGDVVTVEGPKTTYGTTVELVNVTVVKIQKSLIKVDSLSVAESLPVEGGDVVAFVTCKGDAISVNIPEDAKDWLSISSVTSNTVTFRALPNAGGDRSTTVTFRTYSGGKEYTSNTTISQLGAIIECSIAEFLAAPVGDTQYRITGVISSVAKAEYGNVYIKDWSGETYIYGIGSKGDFEALGLKVGDVVTLVGKHGEYKGSPQMTGGQYESHIPVTPVSIAEFLSMPDDKNTYYMVTGTISSLLGSNGKPNDYGNLYITDGTNELYVYGTYPGWGAQGDARKFFIADNGLKEGDELTMIGYKDTYKELVELCGGVCFSFKKAGE